MSKTGLEEAKEAKRDLRSMVDRVWWRQVEMGISIPIEPLPLALRKKLLGELRPKRRLRLVSR